MESEATYKTVAALLDWFQRNGRDLPWRRTRDPYALWVAEIMLQQTQVKTVTTYWNRWMEIFPDVKTLAAADLDEVLKEWAGLGYYRRARHLHQAAQVIVRDYAGRFPSDPTEVRKLPGIGRYTAGAICSQAFDVAAPIVDGNVTRVLTRLHEIRENPSQSPTNTKLWELANDLVQTAASLRAKKSPRCSHINQSLMELGALVCTPKSPNCRECPLARQCTAHKKGLTDVIPALEQRPTLTPRRFVAFLLCRKDQWLVQQRPEGSVNAGLWEFPNLEIPEIASTPNEAAKALFHLDHPKIHYLGKIRHNITRYKITTEVYEVEGDTIHLPRHVTGQWLPKEALTELALPSAHQKIRDRFVLPDMTKRLL